ncbi:MAG: DNA primase [Candidatus Pacebacteria bacterium]|nr:DNA primase [Candidatus Paceibacterota bacterium]
MSSDTTQQIKEKLDIVDFLKQYLELKPAGKNFKANCPFHKEKTPSFMVSPERQTWHCFGACNEGGDIIKFLMKYENLEFYDALKILAEKAGVDISKTAGRDYNIHNILYKILDSAKDFFVSNLYASDSVKNYAKERGLKGETVKEFELGLAPDGSDALTKHLLKQGFNINDIERAGMTIKTERGTYWDRFRSRLMFPIHNHVGKVVGFTGRILPGVDDTNVGKYVNSPESPIFQKSKLLYGFYNTKNDIRETKQAVLVEGQMDFLMAWQDGIKNIAASSGTALTEEHLKTLRRIADEIVLSFDADEAGQNAAERSIDLAAAQDFTIKVLVIDDKDFKDPADIAKNKPGELKKMVEKAKSAMDYYFHKYLSGSGKDLKQKKNNIRIVLSKIKHLASAVERDHWIKELAAKTYLDEKVLVEEMESVKDSAFPRPVSEQQQAEKNNSSRVDLICQRILGIVFNGKNEEFKNLMEDYVKYLPDYYKDIYEGKNAGDLESLIGLIGLRYSFENQEAGPEVIKNEFLILLNVLKKESLKKRQTELKQLINKLDIDGDKEGSAKASKEFDTISKEIHNL